MTQPISSVSARLARLGQGSRAGHRPEVAADAAPFTPPTNTGPEPLGAGAGAAAGQHGGPRRPRPLLLSPPLRSHVYERVRRVGGGSLVTLRA